MLSPETDEINEKELLNHLLFRDLMEMKIDVRLPCSHCGGKGVKHDETCPICDGDKIVTQSMSLYAIGKKLLPLLISELHTALTKQE